MSEEMYDVLDENGVKTGQTLPKSHVHEQELWHGAAFVWIYNAKGELLLQFRAPDKGIFASVWDVSAAGHVDASETPIQAAVRELQEELGVVISPEELTALGECADTFPMKSGNIHKEYDWLFLLRKDIEFSALTLQRSELTNVKWIPLDKLAADLKKPNWKNTYAGRNEFVYNVAINEIKKRVDKNWDEL